MSMISQHIAYLLRRHDYVVVPGIGAFIAQRINARIDETTSRMYPPMRIIGFNAEVEHDDGLLVSSVARKLGVTLQQAQKTVASETDAIRCQLAANGEVAFAHIGLLRREPDGRLEFEPQSENIASHSYLGFEPLQLTAIRQYAAKADQPACANTEYAAVTPRRYTWLRVAASVIVLLALGLSLSTPVQLSEAQLASLAGSIKTTDTDSELTDEVFVDFEIAPVSANASLNIAIPNEAAITPSKSTYASEQKENAPAERKKSNSDNYYLIVASLPSKQLAEKFMRTDGNPTLEILEKDGRFRVYVASGSSSEQVMALTRNSDIASRYPDAWVCRK